MAISKSTEDERERLEQAIAALEAQRAILGDEAADLAVASLRRELAALEATVAEPGPRVEGERRVVTILFCDVTGSTALAESMDPEAWTEIMNAAFERLIEPVERFGGTVARLMGDAVLAFFGAPTAHEDDPQRAVRAGLAILDNIQPFRQKLRDEQGIDFNVRVGINTGLVVVGDVGSDTAAEYTAMGDAVNLAARMEQTAQPGTVQIADNTYRLVAPLFDFEPLGGIAVKGKAEPVQSYRVVGRKASPGRLRGIEGHKSPLIGRLSEITMLQGVVSGLGQDGGGAIICLTGEAGLGKSRLISELRAATAGQAHRWYEAASLSYESGQPYSLIQRLIRRLVGVDAGDPAEKLAERLGDLISLFPPEEQDEIGRLFESLFGLTSQSGQPLMEGEAFQKRLYTAMIALWEEQLRKGPLILVCDDLHWTDPASASLLRHLLPLVENSPLLVLLAMRPESHTPAWDVLQAAETKFGHRCTSLRLGPLSAAEGSQLVESLLAISDLPPSLRALIQEKTQGNPFFVEEVVRTLIEDGLVVQDDSGAYWQAAAESGEISIPDNVQALLAARIDRLEEHARKTLQMAAVVGRSFYYRVLARLVDLIDDLSAQLLVLEQAQFIQEEARQPELEYIFRHVLTQEAAYSAILHRQRRLYHRRVGETLEALFPDRQEEFAGTLAFHFFQAGDDQRALRYYTLAGDASYRLYAVKEAAEYYSRAIECAARVDEATSEQLVHLYIRRGRAYRLDNRYEKAMESYQVMLKLADERGDAALRLASLTAQSTAHASPTPFHDPERAKTQAEEALLLAREIGDRAEEARALWVLLLADTHQGEAESALAYGRQSLAIARDLGLKQQIGYTLHGMAAAFLILGQLEEARRASLEERQAWLEVGNTPMLADSYLNTASLSLYRGKYQEAIADAQEAARISRSIGNRRMQAVAPYYLGLAIIELGDIGLALEHFQRGLALAEQEGIAFFKYAGYGHLILVYLTAGAFDRAEPLAEVLYRDRAKIFYGFRSHALTRAARLRLAQGDLPQALEIHAASLEDVDEDQAPLWFITDILVTSALLHLAQGEPDQALSEANRLLGKTRQTGLNNSITEALLLRGKALADLGDMAPASQALQEAAQIAEKTGQRRLLWQILALMAEVESQEGNTVAAQAARDRARIVIDYMADHTGEPDLRAAFLALPEVQSVLA